MGNYISNTTKQQTKMLEECGYSCFDDMFQDVPRKMLLKDGLNLSEGITEIELMNKMESISLNNKVYPHIFRGAGAYHHYIPAIVKSVVSKEQFVSAYTPYQPEISQGNLQAIFEYQTMICNLTGMDVSNASVYDGASASGESIFMCVDKKHPKVLVSSMVNPEVLGTIKTYCYGRNVELIVVDSKDGKTDISKLEQLLDNSCACFLMQQPNYYGIIEDAKEIGELVHDSGAKFIMNCNPTTLALLETPGEAGADIAVGEAQPLGMSLGFGGPYLGFMAAKKSMFRKLPGRIVGQTVDSLNQRGFVLTLQAREQHIRREKASSNICSNQALCALSASVYLSSMGTSGLQQVASRCYEGAHYLQHELGKIGFSLVYNQAYFHEFLCECPIDSFQLEQLLENKGYLSGLVVEENKMLWCVTEMNTREEIDALVTIVKEGLAR